MGTPQKCALVLMVAVLSDIALAACPRQNLLEDILSPANAERALQILRLASVGANLINPTGPSLLDGLAPPRPAFISAVPNFAPAKQLLSDFQRRVVPRPFVSQQNFVEVAQIAPPVAPRIAPTVIQEKVYPAVPIPQPCAAPALPVALPPPPAPCPAAPVPLVNPFLPAASPVSAMAPPTSSLLPPVIPTQVRSNFLRKIPIPPPSL